MSSEEVATPETVMVSSPVGKRMSVLKKLDRDDLMQCFVLNSANTLRERFAMVRDHAVYLLRIETSVKSLEVVMVEKLSRAHVINCDPVSLSSITKNKSK